MGQLMMEWLQNMYLLKRCIEADCYLEERDGIPLPRDHEELCEALEALLATYRKNFL